MDIEGSFWVTMDIEGVILGDHGHGGGSFLVTMDIEGGHFR